MEDVGGEMILAVMGSVKTPQSYFFLIECYFAKSFSTCCQFDPYLQWMESVAVVGWITDVLILGKIGCTVDRPFYVVQDDEFTFPIGSSLYLLQFTDCSKLALPLRFAQMVGAFTKYKILLHSDLHSWKNGGEVRYPWCPPSVMSYQLNAAITVKRLPEQEMTAAVVYGTTVERAAIDFYAPPIYWSSYAQTEWNKVRFVGGFI